MHPGYNREEPRYDSTILNVHLWTHLWMHLWMHLFTHLWMHLFTHLWMHPKTWTNRKMRPNPLSVPGYTL